MTLVVNDPFKVNHALTATIPTWLDGFQEYSCCRVDSKALVVFSPMIYKEVDLMTLVVNDPFKVNSALTATIPTWLDGFQE